MLLGAANSVDPANLRGLQRHYAGVDSNALTDTIGDPLINQAIHTVTTWILRVYGSWKLAGGIEKINLVASTNNYAAPTDYLQINSVYVNYSGNDNDHIQARIVDLRQENDLPNLEAAEDELESGQATVYLLNDRIYLKRPPKINVTAGIWVYHSSIHTDLSDVADEPVIPEAFHPLITKLGAKQYLLPKGGDGIGRLFQDIKMDRADMEVFFTKRMNTRPPTFRPKSRRESYT